ncbi:MAG: hypothetical protein R2834_19075 [Rhodothermales bacterium]
MNNLISRKKEVYPISDYFRSYLERYGRLAPQELRYEDLTRYNNAIPLYDEHGRDTLWSSVFYAPTEQQELHAGLRHAYVHLKADGDMGVADQLYVDRIDLCHYANTLPYRIRIVNKLNDNYDYFYVKRVDANRIYGLELEHILSPNRIHYLINANTLIEEHIIGIPAEMFVRENMPENRFDRVRLAKEFVKFNERCFVRLLGDMHSGNFVVDISKDFEKWHFRMRPIDFDQQSHHRDKQVYIPQAFPQNADFVELSREHLVYDNVVQYQKEERALIAQRVRVSHGRYAALMDVMREDLISSEQHVIVLADQLSEHYRNPAFRTCATMGDIVYMSVQDLLSNKMPATNLFDAPSNVQR